MPHPLITGHPILLPPSPPSSIHSIQGLLCINHVEIVLESHPRVLKRRSQLRTQNLDLRWIPTPSGRVDAECHAFEVVEELDEVEGADFFLLNFVRHCSTDTEEERWFEGVSTSVLSFGHVPMGKGRVFAVTFTKPASLTQFSICGLHTD